jgi:homoserine kinase type II
MAVFTEVSEGTAQGLLDQLKLGALQELRGIQGGIENTNYFLTSSEGEFVLTLFERLSHAQLPFYLYLMKHLASHGIVVPDPVSDTNGDILLTVENKPAAVVNRLRGQSELQPTPHHCALVGDMLARMHLAGRDYQRQQPNLRGLAWWNETVPVVLPYLEPAQAQLIQSELAFQNHVAQSSAYAALPRGPIHADLFRDNVMFDGTGDTLTLTGFFDFYFAGVDTWLFDIAVCLNDWCIVHSDDPAQDGVHKAEHAVAFLTAYQAVRPLTAAERQLFSPMLRAGALRFWTSRLWDYHLPREASMLQAHDPSHFENVLRQRVGHSWAPPLPEALLEAA